LIRQGAEVIIGADGGPYNLLKLEFPELKFIRFPGYRFLYPDGNQMALKMATQTPAILGGIRKEHGKLQEFIDEFHIDAVISDNRFGLYTRKIPCVFMTHQLRIRAPKFLNAFVNGINRRYIHKYNECWIPDLKGEDNLSGDLSHIPESINKKYFIGPLSRFSKTETNDHNTTTFKYEFTVIVSGPEPQRTIFEQLILEQVKKSEKRGIILQGKPGKSKTINKVNKNIFLFSHLSARELEEIIRDSRLVISRPGYSTIMDLAVLGKQAVFVPTPGQTEQEYLAQYHKTKRHFFSMGQNEFDLETALEKGLEYLGVKVSEDSTVLADRIQALLKICGSG
jgi:UDP-N-acetylglucosamine transferase subunit ALG13